MRFCWHGSAGFSFVLNGVEIIVDPSFSRIGDYGDSYLANKNAPSLKRYFRLGNPQYLMITHGCFDHFDLRTVKRLLDRYPITVLGSAEVCGALARNIDTKDDWVTVLQTGKTCEISGLTLSVYEGIHWVANNEREVAKDILMAQTNQFGIEACGGPVLGFNITGVDGSIYISGDTEYGGIPETDVDVAVMYVGGPAPHPITKMMTKATIDEDDMVEALEKRIKAKAVIPVHYDFQYMQEINITALKARVEATKYHPQVLLPPFNTWVEVP